MHRRPKARAYSARSRGRWHPAVSGRRRRATRRPPSDVVPARTTASTGTGTRAYAGHSGGRRAHTPQPPKSTGRSRGPALVCGRRALVIGLECAAGRDQGDGGYVARRLCAVRAAETWTLSVLLGAGGVGIKGLGVFREGELTLGGVGGGRSGARGLRARGFLCLRVR